ncbi:MAG: bifunctional phosphoribosylaminoimidazolecarboxamide formyltransferase/IMP cyclohydrolase [Ignavibacteria bacterium]|jgi:phosphoribosylaminoimidazolecarboxamide formyltransferase/IMP cyclohydrolase|nr:bifunctional phosphoribosylaminoimidazolecarboxamide formyltransferase/IMP cyclohydrolase [Ignavibacteria bacterium]
MPPDTYKIKTALLSVSDKTGIVEFANVLLKHNITIYSTGGTAKMLADNNVPVHSVSELTNFPEVMDGRVKTLHPAVHGGLLADLGNAEHVKQLEEHHITSIDLLVVNLYPFEQVLKKETEKGIDKVSAEMIENIDIGGPTMLRSAAKNYRWSAVVVNPKHYPAIIDYIKQDGTIPEAFRLQLACEVFNHTAHYDAIIAGYFNKVCKIEYPNTITLSYTKAQDCRYGENPHQSAAVYGSFLNQFEKLHGKELSYNNVVDINSICELMLEFDKPTVAIVKHTNPCGVASADNLVDAYKLAFATDTESPFGGIIALNGQLDKAFAVEVHSLFAEVIIATAFTPDALEILTKKKDRRLVVADFAKIRKALHYSFRSLPDGMLYQQADLELIDTTKNLQVVTKRQPSAIELEQMLFAWKIVKHTKSNAIVYGGKDRTLGIGAGQMSRVESSRIAIGRASQNKLDLHGCVCASDAFFPFADSLIEAIDAGATAVIQPGGSVRDAEVIAEADKHNIAMVFTGMRHFRH